MACVVVRLWNIRFFEENVRHIGVKVLAGVDDDLGDEPRARPSFVVVFTNSAADRNGLYKLGARADYGDNFHFLFFHPR